ncbi:hypothetical protein DFJ63DRAFT_284874 [Scheffersomyces coipomensis]|uniref:uncharacterized protein n=1 Tax=Scheffersomyces coipomensis TaxID=1788519 RepID=UPI00315DF48A
MGKINIHRISYIFIWISFICPIYSKPIPDLNSKYQSLAVNTPSIEVVGNKLFNSASGQQFFIKGIAYQRTPQPGDTYNGPLEPYMDPLADPLSCMRDIQYFKALGVNAVRVYQINPILNHDECMNSLSDAGIYVIADLSEPQNSIIRNYPSWDTTLYDRYSSVIDSLVKYPNTLAFIAGNEVANSLETSNTAPFIKASIRDMKSYISSKNYRKIPVGYASNDDAGIRQDLSYYLTCHNSPSDTSNAEFIGLNIYEWCGYSTYATSGYRELTYEFMNYSVPVVMTEYGCNAVRPRPFTEVEAIYGSTMTQVWSGGVAYEYFEEVNNYGVVQENTDGSISQLEDFSFLANRLNSVNPIGVTKDSVKNDPMTYFECKHPSPAFMASKTLPPTPDKGKCACMQESLTCIVNPYVTVNEGALFSQVCGQVDCTEIINDGYTGVYGKFSDCTSTQKLSYVINKYYDNNNRNPESCNFAGNALLLKNSTGNVENLTTSDGRRCQDLIYGTSLNMTFGGIVVKEPIFKNKTHFPESTTLEEEDQQHHNNRNPSGRRNYTYGGYDTSAAATIVDQLSQFVVGVMASIAGAVLVL